MSKVYNKDTRTTFTPCSSVSVVIFEQVNAGWVRRLYLPVLSCSKSTMETPEQFVKFV